MIIILASLTILGIFLTLLCWVLRKDILTLIFFGITMGLFISTMLVNMSLTKPTALDVYRGNTELKITSVNGVPTDTVVVFKE